MRSLVDFLEFWRLNCYGALWNELTALSICKASIPSPTSIPFGIWALTSVSKGHSPTFLDVCCPIVACYKEPRRVSLVEQELLTLPDNVSSPTILSGVRVTWFLVLYVCFVNRCLSFCAFSFGHCAVCSSSIYGFGNPFGIFKLLLLVNCIAFLIDSALSC
jgi:hypothetical protein